MAARKYFVDLDLNYNTLTNAVLENTTATSITNPETGQIIFDTGSKTLKYWNGTAWQSSETRLEGALQYKGSIINLENRNDNPDNPPPIQNPQIGDLYVFACDGTSYYFTGDDRGTVEVGDFAIYNGIGWDVIQGNTENATSNTFGLVQLASSAEIDVAAEEDLNKVITVGSFKAWANNAQRPVVKKRIFPNTLIKTDGTTKLFHLLERDEPQVAVYDSQRNAIEVLVEYASGSVTLTSNSPVENAYVVITA
jgi:hypothetical protein